MMTSLLNSLEKNKVVKKYFVCLFVFYFPFIFTDDSTTDHSSPGGGGGKWGFKVRKRDVAGLEQGYRNLDRIKTNKQTNKRRNKQEQSKTWLSVLFSNLVS